MTHDTPSLDTLRAMYPVASGSLTAAEMDRASAYASKIADNLNALGTAHINGYLDTMYTDRAIRLDTPVKRAAFALLLTMVDD